MSEKLIKLSMIQNAIEKHNKKPFRNSIRIISQAKMDLSRIKT
jgi:hypothetical protein